MCYISMFWKKIAGKNLRKRVQFVTQLYVKLVPKLPKIQISVNDVDPPSYVFFVLKG